MARNEYDDLLGGGTSYDALIQSETEQKALTLKRNLTDAVRTNPDIYSKTRTLSSQTGIPAPVVERNLVEVENKAKVNEYDALLKNTSALKENMTDSDFAKLASDDLRSLVTLDEMLSTGKKQKPPVDMSQGFAAASRQVRQQQDQETEQRILNKFMSQGADIITARNILTGLKVGRDALIKQGAGPGQADYWFSQQVLQPIGQIKTSTFDFDTKQRFKNSNPLVRGVAKGVTIMEQQAGGALRFGAETLGIYEEGGALDQANTRLEGRVQAIGESNNPFDRNLEGAVASIVSQAPGLAASVGTGTAVPALASMFVQVAGQEYETGRRAGLSYGEATTRASIFGAAEVVGEKFGLGDLIKGLRGAAAGMPTDDVIGYIAKEVAKQIPGEQLTTAIQFGTDLLPKIGLDQDATAEQYVTAVLDTLVQTILQGGIMVGTGVAVNKAALAMGRRQEEARADIDTADLLNQVMAVASNSNLRARDAGSFSQMVQQAAEMGDAAPNELYISGDVLLQALQAAQLEPSALPSVASQLTDAATSGADVVVPVGELAAAFSGTQIESQLLDQSRFSVDGQTVAEQRQFLQEAQDKFGEEAKKITEKQADLEAFEQRSQAVYDKVAADLNSTKRYSADVNNILADLVRKFYVIQSDKLGITPDALYQQFPLRVQGESINGNSSSVLEQESPEFKAWFKQSKVVDQGGKPLRVYHGTADSFSSFDLEHPNRKDTGWLGDGVYVTDDPDLANAYSTLKAGSAAPNVMPLYVSVQNPYVATLDDKKRLKGASKKEAKAWTEQLKNAGHDGVVLDYGNGTREIVAFEPTQVKSAIGNRGTFDPTDPNILNQDRARKKTDEKTYDLFNDAERAASSQSAEQGALGDVQQTDEVLPGTYATRTEIEAQGSRKLGAVKVTNIAEAAQAMAYLGRGAVERFDALVTDKDGKPLAIVGSSKGSTTAASVFPSTIVGEAFRIKGAANIWFAHNHPSGLAEFSTADLNLNRTLTEVFRGSSIEPKGIFAITSETDGVKQWVHADQDGQTIGSVSNEAVESTSVPEMERVFVATGKIAGKITLPAEAKNIAGEVANGESGLMLLDAQNQPIGFVPMAGSTMLPLRNNGNMDALYRSLSVANAVSAIFVNQQQAHSTEQIKNVAGLLSSLDVRVLDVISIAKDGTKTSDTETGGGFSSNKFEQDALGTFDPKNFIITLNQGANLSTFLHEVGHFFLEVQAELAYRPDAPAQIRQDMDALLKWFGVSNLTDWKRMTLNEQRPHHEKFARGFEAYLFEGKAPSVELQGVFQRFRSWLSSVYGSLKAFLTQNQVELTPEVREVMDRLLATDEQIAAAQERRNLVRLFQSAEEAGMSDEEFAQYQADQEEAVQAATDTMNKRSLADIKWLRRARSKAIREFQKEGEAKRSEARMEARREILSDPVYKAWNFLSGKEWGKVTKKEKTSSKGVDPSADSLFTAIAKLGGINRDAAISEFGLDIADIKGLQPVFGKPVFRKTGGDSIDGMAETLSQYGYLNLDENGKYDLAEFEDMVFQELRGEPYYSYAYNYQAEQSEEAERDLAQQLPAGRLNLETVKGMLGKDFEAAKAKIGRMLSSDGLHPDIVADLFRYEEGVEGFTSGRDMINKLLEAVPPGAAIEARTDQIVLERYGDITSDKAAQEAADEALHNEAMLRSAATEMKAIGSMAGSVTAMAKAAKDAAIRAIARVKVKDLRPNKYAAAAMRAGREAETAIKKKDMEGALAAKRNQLLNLAMTQQAYEVQANMRKAMQEFARLRKADKNLAKTHDINLVNTARSILASFGLSGDAAIGNPLVALEALDKVKEYNPDLYEVLKPIATAAMTASRDERGNPIDYLNLTVEEFNGLRDTIRQLMHQARAEKQITVDGKRVDIAEANAALIEQLDATGAKATGAGRTKAVTDAERRKWTLSGLRAGLRRMEHWVESQDLGNFAGPFRTYLFNEVSNSITKYRTVKNTVLRQYVDALQAKEKEGDFIDTKIDAPEFGYAFNGKQELLGAMLHTGNDGNKRKLLVGRGWGELQEVEGGPRVLNSGKWDAFVDRLIKEGTLTKSDFDFLQATWDLMDGLKPDAQQAHFYLYGYYFDEVTNTPFQTPFGEYRGGYAPAKADAELVQEAAIRQGVNEIEQDFNYLMPSTGNGFTKGRVSYDRPLVMDLRLVAQHIDSVLRFTYVQPAISDTLKLVKRGEFSSALHAVDPQITQSMILPWLSRSASQTVTTPFTGQDGKAVQKFFTALRRNTGMMVMTANMINALQQVTGLSLTAVKVDPHYIKSALMRYVQSPSAVANAIADQSEWMKVRLEDQAFDMQKQLEQIMLGTSDVSKAKDWVQRHSYFMQRAMQNMVDVISWSAAYDKAIAENMEEDAAVKYADSIVRQTQGSLLPEDISRMESGNAFFQLFTQFSNYFNMQANLLGSAFANVARTMGIKKGAGKLMYIYVMGFMIPAVMADAIVRTFGWDWDDEDDDGYMDEFMAWFFGSQARTATAMVPGVGPVANSVFNRFNGNFYDDRISTSPSIGAVENAAGAPVSAYKAVFEDGNMKKAIRDSLALLSLTTGVPFSALTKPLGYTADYVQGKVDPANELDAVRGVISGKGREEERVN